MLDNVGELRMPVDHRDIEARAALFRLGGRLRAARQPLLSLPAGQLAAAGKRLQPRLAPPARLQEEQLRGGKRDEG